MDCKFLILSTCLECHHDIHAGKIDGDAVLAILAAREGVLQDDIAAVAMFLNHLPKHSSDEQVEMRLKELTPRQHVLAWRSLNEVQK